MEKKKKEYAEKMERLRKERQIFQKMIMNYPNVLKEFLNVNPKIINQNNQEEQDPGDQDKEQKNNLSLTIIIQKQTKKTLRKNQKIQK